MTGIALQIDTHELRSLNEAFHRLERGAQRQITKAVGDVVVAQTQLRILDERTSPSGQPWQKWSDSYKATRHANQNLLQSEGNLADSITRQMVSDQVVSVGTNLIYAATHDLGDDRTTKSGKPRNIPQREFLGLSESNWNEVLDEVDDWIDKQLWRDAV